MWENCRNLRGKVLSAKKFATPKYWKLSGITENQGLNVIG